MDHSQMGIYIHIPFCIRKCAYCDFLSGPASKEEQDRYMESLLQEIQLTVKAYHPWQRAESVFFGGGTPSVLEPHWIADVLHVIRENDMLSPEAEITVECNPGTLTEEKVQIYRAAGVNRISLGLQSAHNRELALLGRIHTWEDFLKSFYLLRRGGISNVNIDLMSGLPGQTMDSWQDTLKKVTALNPEHISAYSLIIEPGTPFYDRYQKQDNAGDSDYPDGKDHTFCDIEGNCFLDERLPSEELDRAMYAWTKEWLHSQGYERYEISNYARRGKECRHNNFYWTGIPYLGFGIGAASLYGQTRYTNLDDRNTYTDMLLNKKEQYNPKELLHNLRREIHVRTEEEQIEEFVFLGLRRMEGISEEVFQKQFSRSFDSVYGEILSRYVCQGFLRREKGQIMLTDAGIDVSNIILSEFLLS